MLGARVLGRQLCYEDGRGMPALQLVPHILYLRADITLPHHTGLEHHKMAMLAQHMPQDILQMAGRQEN